jgi:hypothetical protein
LGRERDRGEKETAVRKRHRLEIYEAEKETAVRRNIGLKYTRLTKRQGGEGDIG